MNLPEHIQLCLRRLEQAGYAAYAVGGCVRDWRLGLEPKDYDLATAAPVEQTEALFADFPLILTGKKHGTVAVVIAGEVVEITTFRYEGTYSDSRHPDHVTFVTRIEEDLARRDFTVNAMAWSPTQGLVDPFGGREDLQNKILRAVGDPDARFREDSLRILRGVRFAVTYGLEPEEHTLLAMTRLAPGLDALARERVFDELSKLLPLIGAKALLRYAPIITRVIPELASAVGFDQHSPHHAYDVYTHIAHVVEGVPPELPLRFAALLHDVGKVPCYTTDETGRGHFYGHAQLGAQLADGILRRLKAPTALREEVVVLIENHMIRFTDDPKLLRRLVRRFGFPMARSLLALQTADYSSKGTGHEEESQALRRSRVLLDRLEQEASCLQLKALAVKGGDLLALGLQGPRVGKVLNTLLDEVVDERLPNDRARLLERAKALAAQMEGDL